MTIDNTMNISEITISPVCKCFCPLGKAWYTNKFVITITPGEKLPDYCEIDRFIKETMDGKTMIIEDAVSMIRNFIVELIDPLYLSVESFVDDAAHSKVSVGMDYWRESK